MKWLPCYNDILRLNSPQEAFSYLIEHLLPTISTWDYFVDWAKVGTHVAGLKEELNLLNSVVGESDVPAAVRDLLSRHPEVATVFPILIACRSNTISVLDVKDNKMGFALTFDFSVQPPDIDSMMLFCERSGILALLEAGSTRNLVDYVKGVEVGLDSNGRKNRTGKLMEAIVKEHLTDICSRHTLTFQSQVHPKDIRQRWGVDVRTDSADRRFDFAVRHASGIVSLIEVNFYSGPGSKLKSTANEYKELQRQVKSSMVNLIWITDGPGWNSTWKPLQDTFDANDYVLNTRLVQDGVLEHILDRDQI